MENRYAPPSNFEPSEFGAIVKVIGENEMVTTYIQTSKDKDHPDWQKLGIIFDAVYQDLAEHAILITTCVSLYIQKKENRDHLTEIPNLKKV
jgi:hypothetical protein